MRARQAGFTLIELLVVITLIAIASSVITLAMRDPAATRLEQEAARLGALLEMARAESRAGSKKLSDESPADCAAEAKLEVDVPIGDREELPSLLKLSRTMSRSRSSWLLIFSSVAGALRPFHSSTAASRPLTNANWRATSTSSNARAGLLPEQKHAVPQAARVGLHAGDIGNVNQRRRTGDENVDL